MPDVEPLQQRAYCPNSGMIIPLRLLSADIALRKYMMAQYNEANRIGYPKMAAFAVEMSKGSISLPPPTEDDPLHDAVGAFYATIKEIEKRILAEWYLPQYGTLKQKAKRVSKSVRNFKKAVDRLVEECQNWLKARGF